MEVAFFYSLTSDKFYLQFQQNWQSSLLLQLHALESSTSSWISIPSGTYGIEKLRKN